MNLKKFEIIDLNKDDFPDLPLLLAVQMTSAIPIFICPVLYEQSYYVDGAVGSNYPLKYCLEKYGNDLDSVLGIYNENFREDEKNVEEEQVLSFIDYIVFVFGQLIRNTRIKVDDVKGNFRNEVICKTYNFTIAAVKRALCSQEERQRLLDRGKEVGTTFFNRLVEKSAENHCAPHMLEGPKTL